MKKKTTKVKRSVQGDPDVEEIFPPSDPLTGLYKSSIKVLGRRFEAVGSSVNEAISNLKPGTCKGVGILTIQKDKERQDKILHPIIMSRLFNSHGLTRELALKNASILFHA